VVNSFHYLDDHTLSVTCLVSKASEEIDLKIQKELAESLGVGEAKLIKSYSIPRSLPKLQSLNQKDNSGCHKLGDITIAYAGDHLNYGSLNAAMHSGEMAANAILDKIDFSDDM